MGNNHEQYFGKNKRKILILGLQSSGKTSLVQSFSEGRKGASQKISKSKDLNIKDLSISNLNITFFDLAGSERQRVFWKQHYEGTQGIIYVIDCISDEDLIQASLNELQKLQKFESLSDVPRAICLHKTDLVDEKALEVVKSKVKAKIKKMRFQNHIFETSTLKNDKNRQMIKWLLKKSKQL